LKSKIKKKYTAKTDMKRNDNEYHESCFALSISKLETQNFYPNPTEYRFLLSKPNLIGVLSIHNPNPSKHYFLA
jgi:hypothetical protein